MKIKFKMLLLSIAIALIAALYITTNIAKRPYQEPIRVIKTHEQIANSSYIISEELILGKLKSKSQIVSMEQKLDPTTHEQIDDGVFGDRHTFLTVSGTYKMGLNTKDIEVIHINNEDGIVYIKLPKPTLISLSLPYNQLEFDKKSDGFYRLAMDEEEKKNFYKSVEKDTENQLMNNKEVLKQADLHNRDAVEDIILKIPHVKHIVFK